MVDTPGKEKGSGRNGSARRRSGDTPVVIGMAMVTAAVGVGMFMQLALAGWLSVAAALSLFLTFYTLHLLGLRSQEIAGLRQDLQRLEAESRRPPARGAGATPAAQQASPPPVPASAVAPAGAAPNAAAARIAAQISRTPRVAAPAHAEAPQPDLGAPDPWAYRPAEQAQRRPDPAAAAAEGWLTDARPATPHAAAPSGASADGPSLSMPSHPMQAPAQANPTQAHPALAHPAQANPAQANPAQAASSIQAHPTQSRPSQPTASPAGPAHSGPTLSAPTMSPPTLPNAAQGAQGALPGAAQGGRSSSVRDSDVEVIQGLIRKLADEVNSQEVPQQAAQQAAHRTAVTEVAIETSLEALRTTAGTMRERDDAARRSAPRDAQRSEPPALSVRSAQVTPPAVPAQHALPQQTPTLTPARRAADAPAANQTAANQTSAAAPADVATWPALHPPPAEPPADTGEAWLDSDMDRAPADARLIALGEAIRATSADVFLEPILTLVDQRPRHYEVQVRPRTMDGETFADDASLREMLGGSGLLPILDRTRIARVAIIARRLAERGRDSSIFSGFSGESLVDDDFLNEFANAFHERDSFSSQLVLTFSLADVRAITPRERSALEDMRDLGFRFAIDHVTDLDVDFEDLRAQGFQYVKLDADVFLEGLPASGGLIPASDICRHLAELGMTLIVGDIADEAKFARIFGFGVLFGQGQLFGGPRLIKAEQPARRTAGSAAA